MNPVTEMTKSEFPSQDSSEIKRETQSFPFEETALQKSLEIQLNPNQIDVFFWDTKVTLSNSVAGGKAANLQKLRFCETINIPPWFVLPAQLFHQFATENALFEPIGKLDQLCSAFQNNYQKIEDVAKEIQFQINQGLLSTSLFLKIKEACEKLHAEEKSLAHFAVRSSGIMEDGSSSSCAGLFDTFLNICGLDDLVTAIKSVWASSFNLRVIQERMRLGIPQTQFSMGVMIQVQIDAQVSGVVSTLVLSNHYPGIQISANYGLGESVVSGEVSADGWILHPEKNYILEAVKGSKETCHILDGKRGVKITEVPDSKRERFTLNPLELKNLASQVKTIKGQYGCHVDVEYALDQKGKLFILQARPLVTFQSDMIQVVDKTDELHVIAKGHFSVAGVAAGRLVFIQSLEQLQTGEIVLQPEDIALAFVTTNVWSQYLGHIKGLITREGSPSSHPILLSREKQIPCVIGINENFDQLLHYSGQTVTVDGFNKCIYVGEAKTKKAEQADLLKQFEPVKVREWPDLNSALPHLLHNKMAVEHEGKYWRRTPTYPVKGFQQELNLKRFDLVPILLNKKVSVSAKVIDGYTCCELTPFADYVALFEGFDLKQAETFNASHQDCLHAFLEASLHCIKSSQDWKKYADIYSRLRSFIWLGDALRSYAQRKVEEMGRKEELPQFYLDECAHEIQASLPELDTEMHKELYQLALELQDIPAYENIETLKKKNASSFLKLELLGKKYRFEHRISLDKSLDLNVVYLQLKKEIDLVKSGKGFVTNKGKSSSQFFLPEMVGLRGWLHIAIWNRILQSDSHHIDARAKEIVRPLLLQLAQSLVNKGELINKEGIFSLSLSKIGNLIDKIQT